MSATDSNTRWRVDFKRWFHQWGSPRFFFEKTTAWLPALTVIAIGLLLIGLGWGLFWAPPDYQQGNSFRLIYLHVPSASVALSIYAWMAMLSFVSLVWKIKLADIGAQSCIIPGILFTFIALMTGAFWGKPTWGAWWQWDARLTSMLVLEFLFIGVMLLRAAMDDREAANKAAALLAVVGIINLPIIKYSVNWWHTLHQGATFTLTEKPPMPAEMWMPLLVALLGVYCLFAVFWLLEARILIMQREAKSQWLQRWIAQRYPVNMPLFMNDQKDKN
jgi:heme exporter protein C